MIPFDATALVIALCTWYIKILVILNFVTMQDWAEQFEGVLRLSRREVVRSP